MAADGTIKIYTDVDTKGIASGTRRIESSMSKLGGTIKKIGGMIATAFAVQKVVQFGKECLELGSDLQEVQNVVDSVFTTMSDKVDEFAKNAAVTAGLSETMAKKYTGTFGAMAKSFGFTEGQALDMSTALTQLSGDVASFYNLTQDEAYTKLKSVFTGETESLKELGVVMTQAALDEYALANGYGKTTAAMTEQEKVALRYKFVMSQLSTASGDFIRTSDGWANQVRILKLQFESLKATIGQGLINIFTPVLKVINILLAKLATVANAFKSFTELITGKKSSGSTGATSAGLTDTGLSNVGEDYNDAAAGAQNLADATENAADATKDARKEAEGYLSPIDTINKLAKEDNFSDAEPESSGRGSASPLENAVGNVDYGNLAEGETVLEKTSGILDDLINRFKELKNLFVAGFWDGLGDYKPAIEELKKDLASIKKSLMEIFTDPEVIGAANNFVNTLSYTLGQIVGSASSIGLSIAVALVGGIEKFLSQSKDRIKKYIVEMFNVGSEIASQIGETTKAVATIFESLRSDAAQQIIGNLISILAEVGMGITENAAKLGRDILTMITQPIIDNADLIKQALENTFTAIEPFTSGLLTIVETIRDAVARLYDNHLKPLFDSITNGISDIFTILLEGYNTYIVPVLEGLSERFQELMEGPFGEMVAKVEEFLGKLIDSIKLLWESVLLPLFEWIASNIMPILATVVQFIGDTVFSVIESIINIIGDIAETLSGIIDFIVGVFTGDWKLAWKGVKEVFSGVWNLIKDFISGIWDAIKTIFKGALKIVATLVKTAWNGIKTLTKTVWNALKNWISNTWNSIKTAASSIWGKIKDKITGFADAISDRVHDIFSGMRDKIAAVFEGIVDFIKQPLNKAIEFANNAISMINGALGGLENALSFGPWDIPTPFGTKTIGFSVSMPRVSELPYLAQGAVIPPNAPFAAVLGDQRSGNNLEAPESLIRKIVREESGGNNVYKIPVTISGRQLMEIVIDEATLKQARSGKNPLVTLGGT